MVGFVPSPAILEAFFQHQPEGFVQCVIHRNGRGVVVRTRAFAPIVGQQIDVEIPTLHDLRTAANGVHCTIAERNRRKPRRATEAFLCTTVNGVHLPVIYANRAAAEGSDGIQQQQGSGVVHDF